MKILKIILPGMLLFLPLLLNAQNPVSYEHGYYVKTGDMAPDFKIVQDDGKEYMLSDLRGSVVMLQFTASWCSVCRKEMPFIENEIWLTGREKGLKVIGIDRDEPLETVKSFKEKMKITYPLALDPGADIFGLFAEKKAGVTRNVIIDRDGRIIFLTRLFEREEFDEMKKVIFNELGL
ncbi:MAG: TlpA disulfide reductase family protein [Marinilabiliaceae bacterium]|jgi:peroxiredoxin|nr:TlpA disulfide reductase family protein [Marinilabiliaceae bacterium]